MAGLTFTAMSGCDVYDSNDDMAASACPTRINPNCVPTADRIYSGVGPRPIYRRDALRVLGVGALSISVGGNMPAADVTATPPANLLTRSSPASGEALPVMGLVPVQGEPNVSAGSIRDQLSDAFKGKFTISAAASLRPPEHFDDAWYYLPTLAELTRIFKTRASRRYSDGTEILDCEDFAYWLKQDFILHRYTNFDPARDKPIPFAVGILWGGLGRGGAHSANVAVTFDAGVQVMDATPNYEPEPYPAKDWGRSVDYIVI